MVAAKSKRKRIPKPASLVLDAKLVKRLVIYDRVKRMTVDPKEAGKWTPIQMNSVLGEMSDWREQLVEHVLELFNAQYPSERYVR